MAAGPAAPLPGGAARARAESAWPATDDVPPSVPLPDGNTNKFAGGSVNLLPMDTASPGDCPRNDPSTPFAFVPPAGRRHDPQMECYRPLVDQRHPHVGAEPAATDLDTAATHEIGETIE